MHGQNNVGGNLMNSENELRRLFASMKIEYFSCIPYSALRETAPHIIKRQGFTPRSVILFLLPYYAGETVNISRYAAARDYHIAVRKYTSKIISFLNDRFPGSHSAGFGDHSPIDERHAALISSLGILGDNGLLINERYGSYVFIADVITDIPAELLGESPLAEIRKCESCGLCRESCPTGILRTYEGNCLSAVTQRRGELTEAEAELMRKYNTAWGCDICQSVCPHNRSPEITPLDFFKEERITELTSERLAEMRDAEFAERAFAWRGRAVVQRNLELLKSNRKANENETE